MIKRQDKLRQQVKIAKALNDEWNFKAMSEVIQISVHSFYNWLNGSYELSYNKEKELENLISDLIDEY